MDGESYFFLAVKNFRKKIENNEFVEWEEVYPGSYYGTMKSELERIWRSGNVPIFDVDVVGGLNLKNYFGDQALAVFIQPPTVQILEERLRGRGTDNEESLRKRLAKAEVELTFAEKFDRIVINDDLAMSTAEVNKLVVDWIAG